MTDRRRFPNSALSHRVSRSMQYASLIIEKESEHLMTGLRKEDMSMHSIYMYTLDLYSLTYLWQGLNISYAIWRVHPTRSNTIYMHECYDHSKLALYEAYHAIHAPILNAVSTIHLLVGEDNSYDVINHLLYLSIDNTYEHMIADEWKRVINDMYNTDNIINNSTRNFPP